MQLQLPLLLLAARPSIDATPSTGSPTDLFNCFETSHYSYEKSSDPNYAIDSAAYNSRLSFKPVAITFPKDANEVSGIVKCASKYSFKVSARSGGHSYAAYGLGGQDNNVIVDLRGLTEIKFDPIYKTVVTSGTGNRLGRLAAEIYKNGQRGLPHGTCPYVGSGGLTSIGGFGLFSRKYGLLLDTVVSAEVVLADGEIVKASADSTKYKDLFFAIRGSAPSFGIVTSWTYTTFPTQDSIGFTITWDRALTQSDFVTAYSAYQDFSLESAPADLGFDGQIRGGKGSPIALSFLGFWLGKPSEFVTTLAPFLSKLPYGYKFTPKTYKWIDALIFLSEVNSIDVTKPDRRDSFFVKSLISKGKHTTEKLNDFANFLYTKGVDASTDWFIGFDLYGGKGSNITTIASDATAFVNRDAFITYQFYASSGNFFFPYDGIDFVTNMLNSLEPNPQAAYPGYIDPTLTPAQWQAQYYGSNYKRLRGIKKAYDPNKLFDFPQAIEPAT